MAGLAEGAVLRKPVPSPDMAAAEGCRETRAALTQDGARSHQCPQPPSPTMAAAARPLPPPSTAGLAGETNSWCGRGVGREQGAPSAASHLTPRRLPPRGGRWDELVGGTLHLPARGGGGNGRGAATSSSPELAGGGGTEESRGGKPPPRSGRCPGEKGRKREGAAVCGMMSSPGRAVGKFPLHVLVWNNDYRRLDEELQDKDVDQRDPRGRTLLHLAVSLGYIESAKVLLQHKADVTKENAQGWTVLHEAVSTGDPEMVHMILQHRDYQQTSMTLGGVPELLQKINETPDFYVEMKWEFTSWVPLVSRVCPSDVCRIWKSGAKLRVDITLLGFENMSWERGRRSLIFKGEDTGGWAELIEINHDDKFVTTERFEISQHMKRLTLGSMTPKRKDVERRLTSPIINTCLDTKNIAFERTTSGFWVWRTEKAEGVNGYEAKVYTANNVNVVTKIRTEHLTEEEKKRYKADRNPLESFLGTVEHEYGAQDLTTEFATINNPTAITLEEYFNPEFELKDRDIGRPKEVTIRTQKFKATLWMSEEFPLSLMEQVTPIIDLMARTSAHFARLRDFITLEFPPGFPVKIEIPLFHVLNARITFENVNGCRTADKPSSQIGGGAQCETSGATFEVDQSVFEIPKSYHVQDDGRNIHVQDEDNEIMQFAIQQSLLESSGNKEMGVHSNGAVAYSQDFNLQYQRALQESFLTSAGNSHCSTPNEPSSFEKDLQLAMELSVREQEEREKQRREEEDAELQQVLQLSLVEK